MKDRRHLPAYFPAILLLLLCACSAAPKLEGEPARPLRPDSLEFNGWDRDCDLLHVALDLVIDHQKQQVQGQVAHQLRGIRSSVGEIQLHAQGIDVSAVFDSKGRELEFALASPLLTLQLAEPLVRGAQETLTVHYSAKPQRGLYFRKSSKDFKGDAPQVWSQGQAEDTRHWIPVWDYPNERASFSANLRVSDGLVALANGQLLGVQEHEDGARTYSWELKQSIPTYLFAMAAGRWENYSDEWNGTPIEYWVAPGTGEEKARRAFGETPAMMEFFTQLLGVPYPYEEYAQVAVTRFVAGGMENASLTIQNDFILCGEAETQELDGEIRLLVAHELAHQWFGDSVTCFGWSHLWLNEGWASYLEVLYEGHVAGKGMQALRLEAYREAYLRRGERTRRPLSEDWRTQLTQSRCNHEYVKGPWVLHMLEREIGPEDFWYAVKLYLERHAEGLVSTDDFSRSIFDACGRNMEGFFEQWVEGGGHPQFEVSFEASGDGDEDERSLAVRVDQVQRTSELVPLFDVTVDVVLWDGRGETRERLHVSQASETFHLPLQGELLDFQFDATCQVLCELELQKPARMWARQALSESAALRWRAIQPLQVAREAGWKEALDSLVQLAQSDPEIYLRRRVRRGFTQHKYVPLLLQFIQQETDHLARLELLEMLAKRRLSPRTVAYLEKSFAEHPTRRVKKALERLKTQLAPAQASGRE